MEILDTFAEGEMMTKIEWTDETWNPVTGCTKVSAGCKNCYTETIAKRFWGDRKFTDVLCHPERLEIPLHWKKPRRVFVNSMSDLFHPDVPFEFIDKIFAVMGRTQQHTYQVLTKRPELMWLYINDPLRYQKILNSAYTLNAKYRITDEKLGIGISDISRFGLPNVWLGVSVEDQKTADERIPLILNTPAEIRFISYEPALGAIDLDPECRGFFGSLPNRPGIDWLIAGCESGQHARPADIDWFRSVRDQCQAAGVPFFLKQMMVNGKLVKMPKLDGQVWDEFPVLK